MTAPVEFRPDRLADELMRRFPGTSAWFGWATGNWWAIGRDGVGRHHLIEAATPATLARRLDELATLQATPRYSRTRLAAAPSAPVAPKPVTSTAHGRPRVHHRRLPRRGWLRTVFGALVAT